VVNAHLIKKGARSLDRALRKQMTWVAESCDPGYADHRTLWLIARSDANECRAA
jgi:hypothetical protein